MKKRMLPWLARKAISTLLFIPLCCLVVALALPWLFAEATFAMMAALAAWDES